MSESEEKRESELSSRIGDFYDYDIYICDNLSIRPIAQNQRETRSGLREILTQPLKRWQYINLLGAGRIKQASKTGFESFHQICADVCWAKEGCLMAYAKSRDKLRAMQTTSRFMTQRNANLFWSSRKNKTHTQTPKLHDIGAAANIYLYFTKLA